jgi:hypothetical protein
MVAKDFLYVCNRKKPIAATGLMVVNNNVSDDLENLSGAAKRSFRTASYTYIVYGRQTFWGSYFVKFRLVRVKFTRVHFKCGTEKPSRETHNIHK